MNPVLNILCCSCFPSNCTISSQPNEQKSSLKSLDSRTLPFFSHPRFQTMPFIMDLFSWRTTKFIIVVVKRHCQKICHMTMEEQKDPPPIYCHPYKCGIADWCSIVLCKVRIKYNILDCIIEARVVSILLINMGLYFDLLSETDHYLSLCSIFPTVLVCVCVCVCWHHWNVKKVMTVWCYLVCGAVLHV